jgi:hypothetical protein
MIKLVKITEMDQQMPSNTSQSGVPVTKPTSSVKRFFRKLVLYFFFLLAIVLTGLYFYFNFTYSEGNRAGMLTKFSTKGYIFKTYEGELNVGSVQTTGGTSVANNAWAFSVKDEELAQRLSLMEGKMVRLHYREKIKNLPWQGETKYFVDKVELLK